MGFDVVIVGAGQLGSRYLQGVATIREPLNILIVDPSEDSLSVATSRWESSLPTGSEQRLVQSRVLDSVRGSAKLVIVATTAQHRLEVTHEVLSQAQVDYLVLEKNLAQSAEQVRTLCTLVDDVQGSWVNHPRRLMPVHREISEQLRQSGPLRVSAHLKNWGIATNATHLLDLVAWWSNHPLVAVDCADLDADWVSSKRSGTMDVMGTLRATYSDGTTLEIVDATEVQMASSGSITVEYGEGSLRVEEGPPVAADFTGRFFEAPLIPQSALSGPMISTILGTGMCALPRLEETAYIHAMLLDGLVAHWSRTRHSAETWVPVA